MEGRKIVKHLIGVCLICAVIVTAMHPSMVKAVDIASKNRMLYSSNTILKNNEKEMRAVWISFLEFGNANVYQMSEAKFKSYINKMFDQCVNMKLNTVIVQVRPFGDAMYKSSYFPWSQYAGGKQGKNPGYDPMKYMIKAAHARNLEFHAWINPYRISSGDTSVKKLAATNPARKWRESSSSSKKRNVLSFDGSLYYNPAKDDVQKLITNGVIEIVKKYDVDGIHFDDYFYPALGAKYKTNFDYQEYNTYKKKCKSQGVTPKGIVNWRRANINNLLKKVYAEIKKIDKTVSFGISPAGNIANLYAKDRYYADVKTWMNSTKYIDYICPQIYWSFEQKICPFGKTLTQWKEIKRHKNVDLFVGIAAYRAGITQKQAKAIGDIGWSKSKSELKKQVEYARNLGGISGFALYRYDNLVSAQLKKEMANLKTILN